MVTSNFKTLPKKAMQIVNLHEPEVVMDFNSLLVVQSVSLR